MLESDKKILLLSFQLLMIKLEYLDLLSFIIISKKGGIPNLTIHLTIL
jgi:hypothetical protein